MQCAVLSCVWSVQDRSTAEKEGERMKAKLDKMEEARPSYCITLRSTRTSGTELAYPAIVAYYTIPEARKVAKEREKEREAADKLKRANEKLWEEVNLLTLQAPRALVML
eukprot:3941821-Rhodomonas_salina.4